MCITRRKMMFSIGHIHIERLYRKLNSVIHWCIHPLSEAKWTGKKVSAGEIRNNKVNSFYPWIECAEFIQHSIHQAVQIGVGSKFACSCARLYRCSVTLARSWSVTRLLLCGLYFSFDPKINIMFWNIHSKAHKQKSCLH